MKKILMLLSLLYVFSFTHAAIPGEILFGKWRVVAALDSLPTLSLPEINAKHPIGKYLIINQKEVRFQKEIGLSPVFVESQQSTFDYFYSGKGYSRMDPIKLHLPEIVTEISIEYKNAMGIHSVYIQNRDSIVFYWKGFFYKAIRSR